MIGLTALFAVLVSIGCKGAVSVDDTALVPSTLDESIFGRWSTEDRSFSIELSEDATVHINSNVNTPGGAMEIDRKGRWGVDEQTLVIGFSDDGAESQERYSWNLEDQTLILSRTNPELEFVLNRESESTPDAVD